MSRRMAKALCDLHDLGVQVRLVGVPLAAIPDLQVVDDAHEHHVLLDAAVADERRVERHAARRVQLRVERAAREEAGELAALRAERVEARKEGVRMALERLWGPHSHAGLEGLRENHTS